MGRGLLKGKKVSFYIVVLNRIMNLIDLSEQTELSSNISSTFERESNQFSCMYNSLFWWDFTSLGVPGFQSLGQDRSSALEELL